VVALVDGKRIVQPFDHSALLHVDPKQLETGIDMTLLYENTGHDNGGPGMETKRGIAGWTTTLGGVSQYVVKDWRSKPLAHFNDASVAAADVDTSDWQTADMSGRQPRNSVFAYRASVDVTDAQLKDKQTMLRFGSIDDLGKIFVNGQHVGDTDDWSQPQSFDVAQQLRVGKNSITVIVRNNDGAGGLSNGVTFESAKSSSLVSSTLEFADASAGTSGKWWSADLDDSGWEKVSLGSDSTSPEPKSMLTWYRVKFEIPDPKPGVWVPWKIRLDAVGNGFVHLNDHALGRCWEVGPQREYFLPECWLKTGKGKSNVLTLCLRPTDKGAALNKAEVSPYSEWAEKR
jgi:hypothetical protein